MVSSFLFVLVLLTIVFPLFCYINMVNCFFKLIIMSQYVTLFWSYLLFSLRLVSEPITTYQESCQLLIIFWVLDVPFWSYLAFFENIHINNNCVQTYLYFHYYVLTLVTKQLIFFQSLTVFWLFFWVWCENTKCLFICVLHFDSILQDLT